MAKSKPLRRRKNPTYPVLPIRRRRKPQLRDRFNKRTRFIIYKALKARLPISTVCKYANVAESTFAEWLRRGEEQPNNNINSPRYNGPYVTFRNRVNEIDKKNEEDALEVIHKAQIGGQIVKETKLKIGGRFGRELTKTTKELHPSWHAAAWFLERTKPKDYNPAIMQKGAGSEDANELAMSVWEAIRAMDSTVPEEASNE